MSTTLEQLRQIASTQLGVPPEQIQAETSFTELGLDSLMLVDFMFAIEDHYRINIDHDQAMLNPTLVGLAGLVDRLVAAPVAATASTPAH
ncbi:acyl carrier protein [Pelomonas sp. CA6]|uniref:acyl carrier protein n=1 Tax=Pelomonas sp. CA6 TaxID=2907999 RepID=UPI001F4C38C5|nr:acyl carrier protein [Pelomonas sp. CA6]MCH7343203.1 acyl carrier protein [Pelomonas sp. CA6]